MKNQTLSRIERAPDASYGEFFRVIYRTDASDYCRENAPASVQSYDEAVVWAEKQFRNVADRAARESITGFVIELW